LLVRASGNADASFISEALHAGSDVHAVAVNTSFFFNHVSEVNPDAELHPAMIRKFRIASPQLLLDLDGSAHRVHDAGELSEQVVPRSVHHAPIVFLDDLSHYFAMGGQGGDGRLLIVLHEAAVALDVGAEDRGELPLCAFRTHGIAS
jgi:hypothetical protein